MKRVALYVRVSTQEQAQEGYSVGEQKERLLNFCKAHDWTVADLYVDGGFSGSNLNRPGIQKLMSETNSFDIVLVYKLDRLSRSQRDTLYLIEDVFLPNAVDFVSMQESFDTSTPFGKAMIGLLAVFAQLEREQIKERTRMGRMARAKLGLYHGGSIIPTGYNYIDGRLVPDPYEAEQVRLIFKWYLSGLSLKAITNRLNEEGYTNKHSSYPTYSAVRVILDNPVYIGQIHFNGVVVDDAHEPLVSKADFQAVQLLRKKRKGALSSTPFQSKHLLTGLLFCGNCGARYFARSRYYGCYSRAKVTPEMVKDPSCKNNWWRMDRLEAFVETEVRKLLESPEIAKSMCAKKREQKQEPLPRTEKRIKELDRRIDKLMELYQSGEIPPDILRDNINKLYTEKTRLLETLKVEPEPSTVPFDFVKTLLLDAAQIWDFADINQKRRILQSLIKRIILTGEKVDIEWNFT